MFKILNAKYVSLGCYRAHPSLGRLSSQFGVSCLFRAFNNSIPMLIDKENIPPRMAAADQPPTKRVRRPSRMKTAFFMSPEPDYGELSSILERVEVEKQRIYQELEIVKEGAIQAIIQKDETIEELRGLLSRMGHENSELIHTNEHLTSKVEHLETERAELQRDIEKIREYHVAECSEKDALIEELGEQLDQARSNLEELKVSDRGLTQQLENAERTNMELQSELMHSKLQLGKLKYSLGEYQSMQTTFKQEHSRQQSSKQDLETTVLKESTNELKQKVQRQSAMALELLREQRLKQQSEVQTLKKYYQAILAEQLYEIEQIESDEAIEVSAGPKRRSSIVRMLPEEANLNQYSNIELESILWSVPAVANEVAPINPSRQSQFSTKHFSYRPTVYGRTRKEAKTMKSVVPKKVTMQELPRSSQNFKSRINSSATKAMVWGGAALAGFLMGVFIKCRMRG